MNDMKIYIVYSEEYGSSTIEGVFKSRESARKFMEDLKLLHSKDIDIVDPETYRVFLAVQFLKD